MLEEIVGGLKEEPGREVEVQSFALMEVAAKSYWAWVW